MREDEVIQGRRLRSAELGEIGELLAVHPDWHRTRVSRELCQRWDWRQRYGHGLEEFHGVHHSALIALDGTGYHYSAKIHGPCCSHRTPEKGPRIYFHTALTPVVVAPG